MCLVGRIEKGTIPGSTRSTQSYTLTYSKFKGKIPWKSWVLVKGKVTFCASGTPPLDWRGSGQMKLNELVRQTMERENSRQWAKHAKRYSDLHSDSREGTLDSSGFRAEGAIVSSFLHSSALLCTRQLGSFKAETQNPAHGYASWRKKSLLKQIETSLTQCLTRLTT